MNHFHFTLPFSSQKKQKKMMMMQQQQHHNLLLPFFLFILPLLITLSDGGSIGVNYGRTASDLPSATRVVALLRSQSISRVKIYDADPAVLRSLSRSGIPVTVDLPNEKLFAAARSRSFCLSWIRLNVLPYQPSTLVESIAVGNEVFVDTHNTTRFLIPALHNFQWALTELNLHNAIKISTPIALSALRSSYPPSAGAFRTELVETVFKPLLQFLRETGSPLMVNVYPFFAYESNSDVIPLDYALFRDNPGVVDPGNGLRYFNLFDAQLDAVFAAASALGFDDVPVVVTETGWPSKGDENEVGATVTNAAAYNGNLVRRVLTGGGTPLRPKASLTVYLFALFNENKKVGPTSERNYGLFYPSEAKVYDIPFTLEGLKSHKDVRGGPVSGGSGQSSGTNGGGVSKSMSGETWCVASSEAGKEKLQAGLDFACGPGGADCEPIQKGSTCYDPNTVEAHASYAFNSYYQKKKRAVGSCYFGGAAYIVSQPPKYGQCQFPTGY